MGRLRQIVQKDAPKGIDPRTRTRFATSLEKGLARHALKTLENERLVVSLAPAPDPHFDGHMIRVVDCRNPEWYRDFVARHRMEVHRPRVIRALERVSKKGRVRGNGYEVELLSIFKELRDEYARRRSKAFC
jgi:hypothetical protein